VDRPVALIPLVCLKCSTPIPAQPEEVAWVCAQCGQGQTLDDEKGLFPLQVRCLPGIPTQGKGKPFWVVEGKVSLERDTYSGNQAGEAQKFWAQPRLFFIPAFSTSLDAGLELANRLLTQPPKLLDGPQVAFEPVMVSQSDVRPLVDFLVMSIEAARSDKLKELRFRVELTTPALWVFP
jgi:hypothetical protein